MLTLRFKDGGLEAAKLTPPGITIGSDSVSTLVISGEGVRGFHADVRVADDGVWIKDVGSASGTFVNGERIETETLLRPGDVLRIGETELIVAGEGEGAEGSAEAEAWALRAKSGPLAGRVIPLAQKTTVGRADDCDLAIPDARLSREHAQLVLVGDRLSVRDLGSSNGTFHNGRRIERALLAVGDTLAFDKVEFEVIGPAPAVAPIEEDGFDKTVITTASAEIAQAAARARGEASPTATTGVNPNVPQTKVGNRSVSSTGGGMNTALLLIGALLIVVVAAFLLF